MPEKTTGFASPALGYEEQAIDLNSLLITNPPATYLMRLESDDMAALGLPRGSLLIVDRSKDPTNNTLALIQHEGQFLCRLLLKQNGKTLFSNGITEITSIPDDTAIIGKVTVSINEYDNAH